jgi:lipoprotein NlpI
MNIKEYEKAVSDFNKAIGLDPGYKEAYINREIAKRSL